MISLIPKDTKETKPLRALCRSWCWVCFTFVLLIVGLTAHAQPEVEAALTPKAILIGAPATLSLQIKHSPEVTVFWPSIGTEITIDSARTVEVLETDKIDTVHASGYVQQSMKLKITAWDTGFYIIPSFLFSYKTEADTTPQTLQNYPVLLQVNTVVVDTTQAIRPIKGLMDAPWSIWDYQYWILAGVLSVLLLAIIVFFLLRKKKVITEIVAPKPIKTPYQIAIEKLAELEQQQLWQQGNIKGYYSSLSDIMKEYLEGRFQFPAIESTTSEIAIGLNRNKIQPELRERLKEMFTLADLAKFAKVQPLPEDHIDAMKTSKEFIALTRQARVDKTDV